MKLKKVALMLALPMVLGLASCGGETPAESSKPAGSSTPASSSAPKSSSSKSETSKAPVAQSEITEMDIKGENGKAYIVVKGTYKNIAEADQKLAFGIAHKSVTDVDTGEGGWIYGAETPAATDYNVAPVVDAAKGTFEAKLEVSALTTLAAGGYSVWAGMKGFYADITDQMKATNSSANDSTLGGGKANGGGYKFYFRGDVAALIMDKLPPVTLEECFFRGEDVDGVTHAYAFIGGTLGVDAATFTAYTPFVNLQCNGNSGCVGYQTASGKASNWSNTRMDWANDAESGLVTCVVEGTKGYVKVDLTDVKIGGFNTHLNVVEKKQADCKMDAAINTVETPTLIAGRNYAAFCDPTAAASDGDHYWGNLAIIISPAEAA